MQQHSCVTSIGGGGPLAWDLVNLIWLSGGRVQVQFHWFKFSIDVVSACSPSHSDSLLPRRLLPAGLGRAGEEGQALLLPLPALAAAQALSLLPLCPAHGGWRSLGKHLGMDSSLSSSGRSLWALPGCCGRGAGCWTWIRLCNFQTGPAGGGGEEGPPN